MPRWPAVLAVLVALAGCLETFQPGGVSDPPSFLEASSFGLRLVSAMLPGSEPSLEVAADGSIVICSIRGLGSGTDVWISRDTGETFTYVGERLARGTIRSGTGDLGGGDCDLGVDAGGRLYLVDTWLAGVSVASSPDHGETWRGVPVSGIPHFHDRPWVAGGAANEVFVTSAWFQGSGTYEEDNHLPAEPGGIWVIRSTDGGLSFPQQVLAVPNDDRIGYNGNLAFDGRNLFLVYTWDAGDDTLEVRVARSGDRGVSWTHHTAASQRYDAGACVTPVFVFPVVAVDHRGGVYLAWVLQSKETGRLDLYVATSPDGATSWNPPALVTDRPGTRMMPWLSVRAHGEVGLAWYEANETGRVETTEERPFPIGDTCPLMLPEDTAWQVRFAESLNALDAAPTFQESIVQEAPVTRAILPGNGELLQVAFLPDGRAAIAYVSDRPEGPDRPMFAVQSVGFTTSGDPKPGAPPSPRPRFPLGLPWLT